MHVYRKTREGEEWLYTVGYWVHINDGDSVWTPLEDTSKEEEARQLVNYLNGGDGWPFRYERSEP
jgi:hypothetical protein